MSAIEEKVTGNSDCDSASPRLSPSPSSQSLISGRQESGEKLFPAQSNVRKHFHRWDRIMTGRPLELTPVIEFHN